MIDIICHFNRKFPFLTLKFRDNLKSVAFSIITFLDWIIRKVLMMFLLSFCFFSFCDCLFFFCAAAVNRVWLSLLRLLLSSWLLSPLLVVPSTFVLGSVCFILKRDFSRVSLAKTFLQSRNSKQLLVAHPLSLPIKLESLLEDWVPLS